MWMQCWGKKKKGKQEAKSIIELNKRQRRFIQHQRSEWTAAILSAVRKNKRPTLKKKQKWWIYFQISHIQKHKALIQPWKLRETEVIYEFAIFNLGYITYEGITHKEHLISFLLQHIFSQTIYSLKNSSTEQPCAQCRHVGLMPNMP